jgi:hypothetical protein
VQRNEVFSRKMSFRMQLGVINRVLGTSSDEEVSGEEKASLKLATFDVDIDFAYLVTLID